MLSQEMIQKSRAVDIELRPETQGKDMANALALFLALSKLGKRVRFQGQNNIPSAFSWIDAPSLSARNTILALKEVAPFLSRISYEKTDRDLRLQLALKEDTLRIENIAIEKPLETDLTIIVGDNAPQDNKEILKASLMLLSPFEIPAIQLFLKILHAMQYLRAKKLCIAVLGEKDFEQARAHPKDIVPLLGELRSLGNQHVSQCILFGSQGLLLSKTKRLKEKISKFFQTTQKGDWLLLKLGKQEVQKAKEKILFLM